MASPGSGSEGDAGRREHYAVFFGDAPLPQHDGRPLLVVWGNCQAESLRVVLGDGDGALFRTVRVPPVHELQASQVTALRRVVAATDVLVTQPVRDDYRDLPIGTAQVRAELPRGARVVMVPVLRYAGLYPFQAIVRGPAGDPPVVPYHDLRTLVAAATGERTPRSAPAAVYREVAGASIAELVARERRHDTVVVSDVVRTAGLDAAHTVNHPGNTVLLALARRVGERLGLDLVVSDPGRVLLRSVVAPVQRDVLAALGVGGQEREDWTVSGRTVEDAEVRSAQHAWYAAHPEMVAAGMDRHADTARMLGLL